MIARIVGPTAVARAYRAHAGGFARPETSDVASRLMIDPVRAGVIASDLTLIDVTADVCDGCNFFACGDPDVCERPSVPKMVTDRSSDSV